MNTSSKASTRKRKAKKKRLHEFNVDHEYKFKSTNQPKRLGLQSSNKSLSSSLRNVNDNDDDVTNRSFGNDYDVKSKRSFKRGRSSDFDNKVRNTIHHATLNQPNRIYSKGPAKRNEVERSLEMRQYAGIGNIQRTASGGTEHRKNTFPPKNSRIKRKKQPSSSNRKTPSAIESRESKAKRLQESATKRKSRMMDTKKRREKLERDRSTQKHLNSGFQRQQRLKKKAEDERRRMKMVESWMMLIISGARIQAALSMVAKFRQYQMQLELEDKSAMIITRQVRNYKFRLYRKRVRGAIRVLAGVFLVKVRLWKNSRRRVASDKIKAFLLALERDNRESGGCLALIVKGKKWRAYRLKIIILQRLWRQKLRIFSAQILLVDEQWKQEQSRRTELEIERIFIHEQERINEDNEHIDNINRTRRIIKLKPLPKKICRCKEEIRVNIMRGNDLLSVGNIIPTEIRHKLIKDVLKLLRLHFIQQVKFYYRALKKFDDETRDRQRRRALLVKFSGNSWIWGRSSSRSKMNEWDESQRLAPPIKPMLHIILSKNALAALMIIGKHYADELRQLWRPQSMVVTQSSYDLSEVVEIQTTENIDIAANIKRNQIVISR